MIAADADLVLVFPPFQRPVVSMENVGIGYIAASARAQGFSANIINAGLHGLGTADIVDILRRSRFKVLGISTLYWTRPAAIEIARAARACNPDCHIVFGGVDAALDADRILQGNPFVDSVALGEGERTVTELLSALKEGRDWRAIAGIAFRAEDGIKRSRRAGLIEPLDELPFPARDDMAAVLAMGGAVCLSSSRGCPGRCSFCSVQEFYALSEGPAWRGRTPRSVVSEMQEVCDLCGARIFSFIDETVVGPGREGVERLRELAGLLQEAGLGAEFFMTVRAEQVERRLFSELKDAGLRKVEIGIESMAPTQLKRYGKAAGPEDNRRAIAVLDELGIKTELFMAPLDYGVTETEFGINLDFYGQRFGKRKGYDVSPLSLGNYICPYPGTAAAKVYQEKGRLDGPDYAPFRASDRRMQRAGSAVIAFSSAVEPAFPMSSMGLGNLWLNSGGLPLEAYERVGAVCSESGLLLVEFARWVMSVTERPFPLPIADISGIIDELKEFISGIVPLRREIAAIVRAYGNGGQYGGLSCAGSPFAQALLLLGAGKRHGIIEAALQEEGDEYGLITSILDIITKEAEP
jgi:radical SAM superfamily enzyme YgiQ (UPF0313 family)